VPVRDVITPDRLGSPIGTPRCPTILDVRRDALVAAEPLRLPGIAGQRPVDVQRM